jgi:hypothetical protein
MSESESKTSTNAYRLPALRNGDPAAVAMMRQLMKPWADMMGYSMANVKKQLQDEYNVDVDSVTATPPQPTTAEIREVQRLSSFTIKF